MANAKILISGAGIAGPALAYWLLRRGFTPVLVERSPHFRTGGYILDFWGAGFGVAAQMGVVPALRDQGYHIEHLRYVDREGRTRAELGADAVSRALGGRYLSVRRGDLARVVYDLVEDKIETIFGDSIRTLREDDGGVEVSFEHGAPRRFDLVVGCDGLHSVVRTLAFGPEEQFEKYLGYFTGSFVATGYPHRDADAYVSYTVPSRQISRYALREDQTAFFFVWTPKERPIIDPRDVEAQKRVLVQAFAGDAWAECPGIFERLATCDDLYFDAVSQIEVPSWSRGRVALLGDAAFCPSLLAGEGSSFAIAGAYILAGELGRSDGNYPVAFAAYERAFRPFIERKQKGARSFASSFAPSTQLGLFARDQLLRLMNVPLLGDWMIRRMAADNFTLPEYAS